MTSCLTDTFSSIKTKAPSKPWSYRGSGLWAILLPIVLCLFPSSIKAALSWNIVWSDEFNGTAINPNIWSFETGNNNGWGNNELEYYTGRTQNAYVSNGVLHVVARQESLAGFNYTSARVKSQGHFAKAYGRFEFRVRLPAGLGYWPALWLLGSNIGTVGWPACGEVDVMENQGSALNKVQGTIH